MTKDMAEQEMVAGYRDGFDPSSPEPSGNRSHSYVHGWQVGRADHENRPAFGGADFAREHAANSIAADVNAYQF